MSESNTPKRGRKPGSKSKTPGVSHQLYFVNKYQSCHNLIKNSWRQNMRISVDYHFSKYFKLPFCPTNTSLWSIFETFHYDLVLDFQNKIDLRLIKYLFALVSNGQRAFGFLENSQTAKKSQNSRISEFWTWVSYDPYIRLINRARGINSGFSIRLLDVR